MSKHDEMTRYAFISHMESYMKKLLTDPMKADTDEFLKSHGIEGAVALKMLLKRSNPEDENSSIIIRSEKIKDNGADENGKKLPDSFTVKYKLPRKDYTKKMRNLYISLFESNIVEGCPINEMNANRFPELSKVTKEKKGFGGMTGDVIYHFGKNGLGLTDELTKLGKKIEKLSKKNNVYIEDISVDTCDDVYAISFGVKPINKKEEEKQYLEYKKIHNLNEEGEGGCAASPAGATTTFGMTPQGNAMGDVTPKAAFGKKKKNGSDVIRKKTLYITETQAQYLKEATAGDIGHGYTAPMNKGDENNSFYAETMNHKNICGNGGVPPTNESTIHLDEEVQINDFNKDFEMVKIIDSSHLDPTDKINLEDCIKKGIGRLKFKPKISNGWIVSLILGNQSNSKRYFTTITNEELEYLESKYGQLHNPMNTYF